MISWQIETSFATISVWLRRKRQNAKIRKNQNGNARIQSRENAAFVVKLGTIRKVARRGFARTKLLIA
jgi:hypothetical protein